MPVQIRALWADSGQIRGGPPNGLGSRFSGAPSWGSPVELARQTRPTARFNTIEGNLGVGAIPLLSGMLESDQELRRVWGVCPLCVWGPLWLCATQFFSMLPLE